MAVDEFDGMKDADSWDTITRGQYDRLRATDPSSDQPVERPWYDRSIARDPDSDSEREQAASTSSR